MNSFSSQTDLARYASEKIQLQIQRARQLAQGADPIRLLSPRADGGWSAASNFEHLTTMNRSYLRAIEAALVNSSPSSRRDWKPSLAGRVLRWSVNTQLKLKTPRLFTPPTVQPDAAAPGRFMASHEDLLASVETSAERHWASIRMASPAAGFVRLNVGDVYLVLAEHADRHLDQIASLLAPTPG